MPRECYTSKKIVTCTPRECRRAVTSANNCVRSSGGHMKLIAFPLSKLSRLSGRIPPIRPTGGRRIIDIVPRKRKRCYYTSCHRSEPREQSRSRCQKHPNTRRAPGITTDSIRFPAPRKRTRHICTARFPRDLERANYRGVRSGEKRERGDGTGAIDVGKRHVSDGLLFGCEKSFA